MGVTVSPFPQAMASGAFAPSRAFRGAFRLSGPNLKKSLGESLGNL